MPALDSLFEALKFDHLAAQCDALLEQAAKKTWATGVVDRGPELRMAGPQAQGCGGALGAGASTVAQDPGAVRLQLPALDRPQGGA